MAENFVNVTEGSGKKLHSFNRTIGANDVHDEIVIATQQYLASYSAIYSGAPTATANSWLCQLQAGASLNVYVNRIRIVQRIAPGATTIQTFEIRRSTVAGTAGTAVTARPYDSTDAASGATGILLPTAGTEGVLLWSETKSLKVAPFDPTPLFEWTPAPYTKGIRIPAGTANGVFVKNIAAIAAAQVDIMIDFYEANF